MNVKQISLDLARGVWLFLRYWLVTPFFVVALPFMVVGWVLFSAADAGARHRETYGGGIRSLFRGWNA